MDQVSTGYWRAAWEPELSAEPGAVSGDGHERLGRGHCDRRDDNWLTERPRAFTVGSSAVNAFSMC